MYDGLMNAGINQVHTYSSEIISPIYGPIVNKPTRKNQNRPHKKQADPFNRNIDDTGEFKTLFVEQDKKEEKEELDFETDAPNFEVVNEQDKTVVDESLGDTDRLSKISDHINQIKNEAAHIYSNEKVEYTPKKEEKDDTLSHSTISDLIHNFQKEDFNPNLDLFIKEKEPEEDLKTYDDVSEDTDYSEEEDYFDDNSEEDDNKGNSIISKLIIEEPKEKDILEETLHRVSSFQKELNEQLEETNEVIEDVEPVEETFDIEESDNVVEDINDEVTEDSHDDVNEEIIEEDHDDIFDNVEESNSSVADDILNESLEETKDLFSDLFGDE